MKNYILFFLSTLMTISCNEQKTDDVIVIAQPKMEKGTTNSIKILFKNLNSKDSISVQSTEEFELNGNPAIKETERNGEKYLEYYNYIIPKKTGEFTLPKIQGFRNDKILTTKSMDIKVVDKMPNATDKDIILKLISDKKKYKKKDTIHFALYEYSKYYTVSKNTTKRDSLISLPKIKSNGNTIHVETKSDLYQISGIESLEKQLKNDFEVFGFGWDPFRNQSIMEELNGSLYIKTLLMRFDILAKHKGKYTIAPSEFIYLISKSESDYFGNFTPIGNGRHRWNIPKDKIIIKSNELSFIVK